MSLKSIWKTTKYNLSKKGRKEYLDWFSKTHDKTHSIGKYSKKRKKKKKKR